MLDVERRQRMLALIEQQSHATVAELSAAFGVSEATTRRDLLHLVRDGLIERAHGGAVAKNVIRYDPGVPEPPLFSRAPLQAVEKNLIGQAAAHHVKNGDVLIISAGTTTAAMIPYLSDFQGLTVITDALNIAMALVPYRHITTIILGGVLRHAEAATSGSLMEDVLKDLRADTLFVGTPAIHAEYGLSADDLTSAQTTRALSAAANELIVLCDHTKFGKVAMMRVVPTQRLGLVITDAGTSSSDVTALRAQGVRVEVVGA
jgi:DeoR/GlpR family transcriptional regulator of sugar metabolism